MRLSAATSSLTHSPEHFEHYRGARSLPTPSDNRSTPRCGDYCRRHGRRASSALRTRDRTRIFFREPGLRVYVSVRRTMARKAGTHLGCSDCRWRGELLSRLLGAVWARRLSAHDAPDDLVHRMGSRPCRDWRYQRFRRRQRSDIRVKSVEQAVERSASRLHCRDDCHDLRGHGNRGGRHARNR